MKKNILLTFSLFLTILYTNISYSYDFCSDTSIDKYLSGEEFVLENDKFTNKEVTEISNNNLVINTGLKVFDSKGYNKLNELVNDYFNTTNNQFIIESIESPLFSSFVISKNNDSVWIKENINKYGFVYLYEDNAYILKYISTPLLETMKNEKFQTLEGYIKGNNINCSSGGESDSSTIEPIDKITQSYVNAPGTFSGGYNFLDENFINLIKVNLIVSDGFKTMEDNFKSKNMSSFEEEFLGILEMIEKDKTLSAERKKYFTDKLSTPGVRTFISQILPSISLMEHGGNTKQNPGNNQGVFQLYAMEKMFTYNNFTQLYFTPANKIKEVYGKHQILTKEQFRYQLADIALFMSTNKNIDTLMRKLTNADDDYSYDKQLREILKGYKLKLSIEDENKIVQAIIRKDENTINDFLQKYKKELYQYNIIRSEDMYIWLEEIMTAMIGTYYNGFGNNGNWRKFGYAKTLLDNNYVSNSVKGQNCFWTIATDGSSKFENLKKTEGLIMNYLQYNYPSTANDKQLGFIALIKKMADNKQLFAYAGKCN